MIRSLTQQEISAMEAQGCTCADWTRVRVDNDFRPDYIRNVEFSGDIRLGRLEGTFTMAGGLQRHSAISDVTLHNVSVGNDVLIRRVADSISNYDIADGVCIENADALICTLDSSFGIGTEVSVLNETGGREVPIYENMSAHTAYLIA
ncbi:MAG: DUF4954 family protein, partial [Muribaculaceae bacterium]|nr:DUF4954 family protein [Muribaculaceae bacterium]